MFIWLSLFVVRCSAFVLDTVSNDQCLAPPPCYCKASSVVCDGSGLSTVPDFKISDREYPRLLVNLNYNNIREIDNTSFTNLYTTNASELTIYLSNNDLSTISDSAFSMVTSMITYLNLKNNNLSEIPNVLGTLPNLENLDLRGNPIRSMAVPVTFAISKSIKSLSISLNLFSSWPKELHYFRLLSRLVVDGFQEKRFPLNALTGIETTLTSLEISNSRLDRIPSVVCHLPHLRRLSYTSNPETKSPIFEPCNRNVTSLVFLSVKGNNLTHFPDVFNTFVSLDYLDVGDNQIRTIDTDLIPLDNSLTHLNLSYNHLNRIPTAVNRFAALKSLYIAGNRITSLEDNDLSNLTHMSVFQLENNPLEYISNNAFKNIQSLAILNLESTNLDVIPKALTSLASINRLSLEGTPIQCTCKMDYLKSWANNSSRIYGTCEGTMESLSSFITTYLPLCP
ncbi:slit homolog 3 protein-like [Mercenaria mercenaria]|uniref:slit homolog 3 protein-like n=1 Tax=Mercenaria mercenaria TaxID=6596 RepID=UPI001E1D4D4B|nr:slit homolog 3 protein-like [Mercenaria mercenaria]